uniref:FAD-dependent monooxygenase n=1 Tax=Nonomuraea pusilla TaxID=46177 RepID=UPI0006E2E4CA|nr:FAD-dependent monooxygenase [Nonomuraea pusilla]
MKIACVGGGPAGLYFSILMKGVAPSHDVTVYERNPAGSTYGWGVTYSESLLRSLHATDPESARAILDSSVRWDRWDYFRGPRTMSDPEGGEGFGIGRQRLLDLLAERARGLGVRIAYEREITDERELADADLVVAGDGAGSRMRERHAVHFGTEVGVGRNSYVWLGSARAFDSFVFSFEETEHGWIWCYGYPYSPDRSTCVVECAPETWKGLGFDRAKETDTLVRLEKIFAGMLDGHPLLGQGDAQGSARWLNFRTVSNRTWHRGNLVLAGDAAHTTHYSIGAGTTLALRDAALLAAALLQGPPLPVALARYERQARSAVRSAQRSARYSSQWYENLPRYTDLPLPQMVLLSKLRGYRLVHHLPPKLCYFTHQAAVNTVGRIPRAMRRKAARPIS